MWRWKELPQGYKLVGLLSPQGQEAFISSNATTEYLDQLKKRIAGHGLVANVGSIRFRPEVGLAEIINDVTKQIENAARVELKVLLTRLCNLEITNTRTTLLAW